MKFMRLDIQNQLIDLAEIFDGEKYISPSPNQMPIFPNNLTLEKWYCGLISRKMACIGQRMSENVWANFENQCYFWKLK